MVLRFGLYSESNGSNCLTFGLYRQSMKHTISLSQSRNCTGFLAFIWAPKSVPSEKAMAPPSVLLPGKSHGRRSLGGCSPWGRYESDTTERLHFPFSLSCIGEGNGNPLQCSCLENPRDRGVWWAVVYGVAQSQTRLKWLSSSSSSSSKSVP